MRKLLTFVLFIVLIFSFTFAANAADEEMLRIADDLHKQGLLSGVAIDSEGNPMDGLDSHLTRQQAATLLVKLMGAEEEAINSTWENDFADVEKWAKPFVGYAYANKITSGMRADYFGAMENISASQYITFILKYLGYSAKSDFSWDQSWELSDTLGITNGQYNSSNDTSFLRADAIRITYATLLYKKGELPAVSEDVNDTAEENTESAACVPEKTEVPAEETEAPAENEQASKPEEEIIEQASALSQQPEEIKVYQGDQNIVTEALKYEGYPYVAGGKGPNSFDCSGFCIYVLKQCGYKFTAGSSQDLYNLSSRVSASDLKPGDLVFFKGTYATSKVSHSGIYIGNGKMIHAGTTRTGVCIVNLSEKYWANHFYAYGRMSK